MGQQDKGKITTVSTWIENKAKINGLWPQVSWTEQERNLWSSKLESLDQVTLSKALEEVATQYASQKPALKWVLGEYKAMRANEPMNMAHQELEDDALYVGENMEKIEEMRKEIKALTPDEQERVKNRCKSVLGIDVDFEKPLDQWSNFSTAMVAAAIH
tara:strand:+ start:2845 stop:3321 length:477 start_codon:yes stop_codon:yes gene_type:complete